MAYSIPATRQAFDEVASVPQMLQEQPSRSLKTIPTAFSNISMIAQAATAEWAGLLPGVAQPESIPHHRFTFDGQVLFELSSTEDISAEQRSQLLGQTLNEIARTKESSTVDRALPVLSWEVDPKSKQPVLYAGDRFLLTVLPQDAALNGFPDAPAAAQFFEQSLTTALETYRRDRQPQALKQQLHWGAVILGGACLVSLALWQQQRRLARRIENGSQSRLDAKGPSAEPVQASKELGQQLNQRKSWPKGLLKEHLQRSRLPIQGFINSELKRGLILLLQLALWAGCSLYLFDLIAPLRPWNPLLLSLLNLPFQLLLIGLGSKFANQLGSLLIDRLCVSLMRQSQKAKSQSVRSQPVDALPSQRLELRFSTLATVGKGIWTSVCITSGVMLLLLRLGIDLAPVLAGAGIVGLGLSLASQSLLKDIINGFFILLEDQYGVGDVILIGEVAGFVEKMNLRITQLRNEEGRLITVPNSQISIVQNLSKEWSRVDLIIPVDNRVAVDRALELVRQVAEELSQAPHWRSLILDPTEVVGVEQLDHSGTSIRLWLKTLPLKQWDVAREYRRRLKQAFDNHGIALGAPHQVIEMPHRADVKPALKIAHIR